SSYEPRRHIWVSFKICAVPITWFSCVREFFNAIMGILVGKKCHYNGWKRRQVLHSDLSNSNAWMCIQSASSINAVPDWPPETDCNDYPQQPGMLGDWGMGQDISPGAKASCNHPGFITGTFPFQSAELLQGDQATHRLNHDLEALFWVVWIICVNVNRPFNNQRQW
ncbi:hypothetical protein SCLCIDRAFT_92238, partial [Scleroderma citrinum Foug A]